MDDIGLGIKVVRLAGRSRDVTFSMTANCPGSSAWVAEKCAKLAGY
jgi:hypothetical protein